MSGVLYWLDKYYNVSSIRMMRFLYALGFAKESYFDKNGKEKWRFLKTDDLLRSVEFYKEIRKNNGFD